MLMSADPIRSSWLMHLSNLWNLWAADHNGRLNGNGTGFAASSSGVTGRLSSGRAVKNWLPNDIPRLHPSARSCLKEQSSTVRFSRGKMLIPYRSRSFSGESAARPVTRAILSQVPVIIMAYDLLEYQKTDIRSWPVEKRRAALAEIVGMARA